MIIVNEFVIGTAIDKSTDIKININSVCYYDVILVSRGRTPFCQHQESRPLAQSNDIPVLNGFVNTID